MKPRFCRRDALPHIDYIEHRIPPDAIDKARVLDMNDRSRLASACYELRAELKEWEKSFADTTSGRKPGKEDIKKNVDIAAKYKTYYWTRDALDGKKDLQSSSVRSPYVRKHKSSSLRRSEQDHGRTSTQTLFATPRKARLSLPESHPSILDPYDAPPQSVSPHPYVFKNAIGPTPQRDGKILGLFDCLSNSGSTPSTRKRKADMLEETPGGRNVAQTPSRKPTKGNGDLLEHLGESSGGRRNSRTPVSDGKKFLFSQFFATPSTMRFAAIAEEDPSDAVGKTGLDQTPLRSKVLGRRAEDGASIGNILETTPAYLKRTTSFNQRLLTASGSNPQQTGSNSALAFTSPSAVRRGPIMRPFKGRALSEILRGLRQMEDNDDEDEMDALREVEGNDLNVLVGDIQDVADPPAMMQEPVRTWKKKGQKRTTRKVIMRPSVALRKPRDAEFDEGDDSAADNAVAKVVETQTPAAADQTRPEDEDSPDDLEPLLEADDRHNKENRNHVHAPSNANNQLANSDSDPDFDELASTPPPKKRKIHTTSTHEADQKADTTKPPTAKSAKPSKKVVDQEQATATKQSKEKKQGNKKGSINPNAHSHLNFRSLKIRNKNSKGKGRFGGGRGRR